LRKEYEKDMDTRNQERERKIDSVICQDGLKLSIKDHEKLCEIASLKLAAKFSDALDERFEKFENKLFKALKINGYADK
jgi:hypothetical protein